VGPNILTAITKRTDGRAKKEETEIKRPYREDLKKKEVKEGKGNFKRAK